MSEGRIDYKAAKEAAEFEMRIFDAQPRYVRDFINEHGSPIIQWLREGHSQFEVSFALPVWVGQCLEKQRASQPHRVA